MKVFRNGETQMTGVKDENHAITAIENLITKCKVLHNKDINVCINENPNNLKPSNIKTCLINSDFNTRFNNNLSVINTLLKDNYKIYRYYQPNNRYAGVIVKFMYNEKYLDKTKYKIGRCYCSENCAITKKKKDCTIITISIFRPGSIIITAAKNIKQLKYTYDFINTFFKTHYQDVAYLEDGIADYYNQNEDRKIIKKPNIYYVEKNKIQL